MDSEILVNGHGQARGMPDRAVVHVTAESEGRERDDAYGAAATICTAIDAVLAAHADAVERTVTSSVVVQPTTRWHKGATVKTGWQATRTSTVSISGIERLGELVAALIGAGAAVVGPEWELDPGHPAHAEARRLAARDAKARAVAYADALGLHLGSVAWIAEPGLRRGDHFGDAVAMPKMAMMRGMADTETADTMDVRAEEVTVVSDVEIGFAFVDPDA